MSIRLESFRAGHISDSASLAAAAVRRLRAEIPLVPATWESAAAIEPILADLAEAGSGVAAFDGPRLTGHLVAWPGARQDLSWAFSPEVGNVAEGVDGRGVREAMYAEMAADWVARGTESHVVAVPATDRAALETWQWLGFGVSTVDAIRDLRPIGRAGPADVRYRRGGPSDVDAMIALEEGLRVHVAGSPVFFVLGPPRTEVIQAERLSDPAIATFIAEDAGGPVGYLRIGPAADDGATIIRDPGTASITGAFTVPERRGKDIASTLLDAALSWARTEGYVRCAVDFESANLLARRFWLRFFTAVVLSLTRRIDPR